MVCLYCIACQQCWIFNSLAMISLHVCWMQSTFVDCKTWMKVMMVIADVFVLANCGDCSLMKHLDQRGVYSGKEYIIMLFSRENHEQKSGLIGNT